MTEGSATDAYSYVREIQEHVDFPLSAMIELTRRCNQKCAHCYLDLDGHGGLPTELLKKVIDDLARAGSLFLTFTGGELMLRSDWLELARYGQRKGFVIRLKTNGTMITEEVADQIESIPVIAVDVSLYGASAEAHDRVTGMKGSFDRVLQGIELLRARSIRVQTAIQLINLDNAEPDKAVELAKSLGCVPRVGQCIFQSLDSERDTSSLSATQKQIESSIELYGNITHPSGEELTARLARPVWSCLVHPSSLCIKADGEVWLCPTLPISFGSVLEAPIDLLWRESPVRRGLAERAQEKPSQCVGCEAEWACGRCAASAMLEHGSLERPGSSDCRLGHARSARWLASLDSKCDTTGDRVSQKEMLSSPETEEPTAN